MQLFFLLWFSSVVVLVFAMRPASDILERTQFELFKEKFGKTYSNSSEEKYRFNTFRENFRFIMSHNTLYDQGLKSFRVAVNDFADMTTLEMAEPCFLPDDNLEMNEEMQEVKDDNESDRLPEYVNWVRKGAVTDVKDQRVCGSCYCFSSTGSLEGQRFLETGQLISLSEQNILDCSTSFGNHGCKGGGMGPSFKYIKDNGGIDTEESYPYEKAQSKCRFDANDVGATASDYLPVLPRESEKALQTAVATVGPISIGMDAHLQSFRFYHDGVYDDPECSPVHLDHAVLAVGYGTDYSGTEYWLVKNSWGRKWGMKGYVKIARNNKNQCGVASHAGFPVFP